MYPSVRHILTKVVIVVISSAIAVAFYLTAHYFAVRDFKDKQHEELVQFLQNVQATQSEILKTLSRLNQQIPAQCDEGFLTTLRKEVFHLKHVKDIGFFKQDKLVCTTGLGILNPPVASEPPDFVGLRQAKVWVDPRLELFGVTTPSIVIRLGQFNAVLFRESLADLVTTATRWELVFKREEQVTHLAGTEGLFSSIGQLRADTVNRYNSWLCVPNQSICIVISASQDEFSKQNRTVLLLSIVFSTLLFLISMVALIWLQRRYDSLEHRVLRGLRQQAFYCQYQPIVDLHTEAIVGVEVLARYQDADGPIYPDQFIPIIISRHKTWEFTRSIVKATLTDLQNLPQQNSSAFKVNINFFPQDINSGQILELLDWQALQSSQFSFVVEIIENEQLTTQTSRQVLQRLVDAGLEIAVDDFGTGYSNLSQLIDYKCHTLKIDRSFISEMEEGAIRSSLIPHIIGLAGQLKAKVVAEGIENRAQYLHLRDLGVQFGQGYLFSRPVSLEALQLLLK